MLNNVLHMQTRADVKNVLPTTQCFSRFLCLPLVCAVSVLHHFLSLLAQVVQSVEMHTLGTRFCHIMFLFGL